MNINANKAVCVVPWANFSEWQDVRKGVLSEEPASIIRAYQTMMVWKCRVSTVPAYIECTCGILQVMMESFRRSTINDSMIIGDHDVRLLYSTALIRFVNHVLSVNACKGDSLYHTAKSQNILDWIVNLRHDAAHGLELPPLDALQSATLLCLQWLVDNYWTSESVLTTENSPDERPNTEHANNQILELAIELLKLCFDCQKSHKKYVADMPRNSCSLMDTMVKLWKEGSFKRKKKTKLAFKHLQSALQVWQGWIQSQDSPNPINRKATAEIKNLRTILLEVIRVMYSKASPSESLVVYLLDSNFLVEHTKPTAWLDMLLAVVRIGALPTLIKYLFCTFYSNDNADSGKSNLKAKMATEWLNILVPSIKSLKNKWTIYQQLLDEENGLPKRKLKVKAHSMDSTTYSNLVVDLGVETPPTMTLDMLQQVLRQPDSCPRKLVLTYLKLVEPPLPPPTRNRIKHLLQIYQGKQTCNEMSDEEESDDKVYTAADLLGLPDQQESHNNIQDDDSNRLWTKSQLSSEMWERSPLGLMPHQTTLNCNVPSEVTWAPLRNTKRQGSLLDTYVENMKKRKQ